MSRALEDRLLRNSYLDPETGCWVWLGKAHLGYGFLTMRVAGRRSPVNRRAHRISYEVFKGKEIGPGMEVNHKCYNTRCINPEHLEEVTATENLALRRYA